MSYPRTKRRDQGTHSRIIRETLAVVMAGGRGRRLNALTSARSKPAVPFGGKYRIIDFTLSNCINSGIRRISLLTQYRAHSLLKHMERNWSFSRPEFGEFIEILPAQERYEGSFEYQGTADAVFQNLDIIREHRPKFILVLAGDHIYKMDYGMMITAHLDSEADITVGCIEVPLADANQFGVMTVDAHDRVVDFQEKPEHPTGIPGREGVALASMGIYLFGAELLDDLLSADHDDTSSSHDFGKNIIPNSYRDRRVVAYPFRDPFGDGQGYWRDVGTVDAYWEANIELTSVTPPLNLYDQDWPIRTAPSQLPPAKFVFDDDGRRGMATDSLVSAGCILSGASVQRSVLCNNVRIDAGSEVQDAVILPDVSIGENCRIRRAVIDIGCNIQSGTTIGFDTEADRRRFQVTEQGIVLVSPQMLGQSVTYAS
ncbi:MAG: glucose-1-phosphate adenylyltransferase [Gammaproteobacteria bacterium]|nr:glucose-1-phosphate adenylyltransferase [Gammaproteobacteria bacterium]